MIQAVARIRLKLRGIIDRAVLGLSYCLDSALRSASMRLVRMSLMRVR